jgi:phage shock protein PspC (stress-responsive transcriptional regulator)
MMKTKLYRSRKDRMIGGVCEGLGQYLGIDSLFVRLFFVLLAIGPGIGVMVYLVLWILLPSESQEGDWQPTYGEPAGEEQSPGSDEIGRRARAIGSDIREAVSHPNPQAGVIIGASLVILGIIYLLQNLDIAWLRWLNFDVLWPFLLILGGIALLARQFRGN